MAKPPKDSFAAARNGMVAHQLLGRDIHDERIFEAMRTIPREKFVPPNQRYLAYADGPLSIGFGQTISQPYIVALMTELLQITPENEVIEIGTGSGYQTAILAKLAKKVYTVERIEELSVRAKLTLEKLAITNVRFQIGDGTCGWSDDKTFDRIIITAAAPAFPPPLAEQLKIDGIAVAPLGGIYNQILTVIKKDSSANLIEKPFCGVRFVPLIGKEGYKQ